MGAERRQRLRRAERIDYAHAQQEHASRGDEGDNVAVEVGGCEHRDAADERDQQSIANGPIQPEARGEAGGQHARAEHDQHGARKEQPERNRCEAVALNENARCCGEDREQSTHDQANCGGWDQEVAVHRKLEIGCTDGERIERDARRVVGFAEHQGIAESRQHSEGADENKF
jgi:hypothetical protein